MQASKAKWQQTLVWSLIAAAFIGPGTVATATRGGVAGGYELLPAVVLAAVAGYLLMEMAARITTVSGQSLGEIVGRWGKWIPVLVFGAVALGCAAYQAGNLVGALGGIRLLFPAGRWWMLLLAVLVASLIWRGNTNRIAAYLATIVALMGLLFLSAASYLLLTGQGGQSGTQPTTALFIGLIGTTIVPYNFFLAAGLRQSSDLRSMRKGIFLSFLFGGLITAAILVVGTTANSFDTFSDLAYTLDSLLAGWGNIVLGVGLFVAGFSSATTAPLAAAIAGRELLGRGRWSTAGASFRAIWLGVLSMGLVVGLLELNILYVIVAAQIINGILLPLIAIIVMVLANNRQLLGKAVNSWWQNLAGGAVVLFLLYKNVQLLLGL